MSAKILIIEDEKQLARLIELELYHEGYEVEVAYSGIEGLEKLKESDFQLVLLDLMLPGIDGYELCSKVREFSDIPIIMVTARDAVSDKVKGLDTGADDYITKPFSTEELMARIRAQLRRNSRDRQEVLKIADLEVDTIKYRVKRAGELVELTKKEYDLLVYLLENEGIVLSREDILNAIWGYDYYGETNIVDVYIRYLRSKIDDPYEKKLIHTVRGVGYVLRDEE
jgi:DNA-binding response OmpR family regulator